MPVTSTWWLASAIGASGSEGNSHSSEAQGLSRYSFFVCSQSQVAGQSPQNSTAALPHPQPCPCRNYQCHQHELQAQGPWLCCQGDLLSRVSTASSKTKPSRTVGPSYARRSSACLVNLTFRQITKQLLFFLLSFSVCARTCSRTTEAPRALCTENSDSTTELPS